MMIQTIRCILALSWLVASNMAIAGGFDFYLTGNGADVKPAKTEGALMLMGGGGLVDEAFRWFIQKAGGGDIVILKVTDRKDAVEDTYGAYLHGTVGGCDSVQVIAFHNRTAASDPQVLEIITQADGIFLGGGKQFLYTDYWKGTPVAAALAAHVRAGRPLGGSSAGLAVLGQMMYTAHVTARLTTEIAMKNPFDKSLTFETNFLQLDLMRGVVTDTHFSERNRMGRLITFMARAGADYQLEPLLGIGVDEKTALCIEADGTGRVRSLVAEGRAWLVQPQQAPEVLQHDQPLTYRGLKAIAAGPESRVNLVKRTVEQPAATQVLSVVAGKLETTP